MQFYFLYVMMNMPLYNVIIHLVYYTIEACYTIEASRNMYECDGFKISNQLFSAQEFSKKETIAYPVVVVQLGDKQLGV